MRSEAAHSYSPIPGLYAIFAYEGRSSKSTIRIEMLP